MSATRTSEKETNSEEEYRREAKNRGGGEKRTQNCRAVQQSTSEKTATQSILVAPIKICFHGRREKLLLVYNLPEKTNGRKQNRESSICSCLYPFYFKKQKCVVLSRFCLSTCVSCLLLCSVYPSIAPNSTNFGILLWWTMQTRKYSGVVIVMMTMLAMVMVRPVMTVVMVKVVILAINPANSQR